eukprot:1725093-Amphidinium_carterae.1
MTQNPSSLLVSITASNKDESQSPRIAMPLLSQKPHLTSLLQNKAVTFCTVRVVALVGSAEELHCSRIARTLCPYEFEPAVLEIVCDFLFIAASNAELVICLAAATGESQMASVTSRHVPRLQRLAASLEASASRHATPANLASDWTGVQSEQQAMRQSTCHNHMMTAQVLVDQDATTGASTSHGHIPIDVEDEDVMWGAEV